MEHFNLLDDVRKAVKVMADGGIILYPTDTIWGIGCDATNSEAVAKIYTLKKRIESKSMLVLVDSEAMLERSVENVPEVAWQLIDAAVHPITIIYDHASKDIAPNLVGPDGSLGVRITGERYSSELCRRLRRPIVSTSANVSGTPSPKFFSQISAELLNGVDYVAEYRRNDTSSVKPSNIIKLSDSGIVKVIR